MYFLILKKKKKPLSVLIVWFRDHFELTKVESSISEIAGTGIVFVSVSMSASNNNRACMLL